MTVAKVFSEGVWCLAKLATVLPDFIRDAVLSSTMVENSTLDDLMCWADDISGIYASKGAYLWLLNRSISSNLEGPWPWIWKLPVEEKVRSFLWQIFQNALPTAEMHFLRHMAPHPMCSRY